MAHQREDTTAVAKALLKRQTEFEAEAFPHKDILLNFALRTTGDADDAKDLLQETFMKAFRFWDKYEKGTNIRAWLFRIMKNSYINRYRKETREPGMVDYDDVENFYDSIRDNSTDSNDLQKRMFSNMLSDEVTTALQSLPEDFRTVVILCDIEQLTYEEISDFLNCPIGTVRSRLHRGRKMLEEKLRDYAKERGIISDEPLDYLFPDFIFRRSLPFMASTGPSLLTSPSAAAAPVWAVMSFLIFSRRRFPYRTDIGYFRNSTSWYRTVQSSNSYSGHAAGRCFRH